MEKRKEKYINSCAKKLSKSMYKAVIKALHNKEESKEIVEDILDPNYVAEVDPDKIPSKRKVNVVNKSEGHNYLKYQEKGVHKLKQFLDQKKAK